MFNLSLTACSFHLRKTNSRGNTKIFNLNMPLTLQKEDGTECYFQDLSEIFVQFFKTHESLVKDDNKQQSFRCEYNEDNILENDDFRMFYTRICILCAFADKDNKNSKYKQLLKETFNATIFEALVCLLLLFISFVTLFIGEFKQSLYLQIISGSIYYLAIVAVLNILVIIKRLKVLFENK